MECGDLGYMIIYSRNGHSRILSHDETVRLCMQSQNEGIELPKLIKRDLMPDLKLIKFRYDENNNNVA
ncbi:MAG: hypothetical protein QXZ44_00675 [Ferroplasma sp.]